MSSPISMSPLGEAFVIEKYKRQFLKIIIHSKFNKNRSRNETFIRRYRSRRFRCCSFQTLVQRAGPLLKVFQKTDLILIK